MPSVVTDHAGLVWRRPAAETLSKIAFLMAVLLVAANAGGRFITSPADRWQHFATSEEQQAYAVAMNVGVVVGVAASFACLVVIGCVIAGAVVWFMLAGIGASVYLSNYASSGGTGTTYGDRYAAQMAGLYGLLAFVIAGSALASVGTVLMRRRATMAQVRPICGPQGHPASFPSDRGIAGQPSTVGTGNPATSRAIRIATNARALLLLFISLTLLFVTTVPLGTSRGPSGLAKPVPCFDFFSPGTSCNGPSTEAIALWLALVVSAAVLAVVAWRIYSKNKWSLPKKVVASAPPPAPTSAFPSCQVCGTPMQAVPELQRWWCGRCYDYR